MRNLFQQKCYQYVSNVRNETFVLAPIIDFHHLLKSLIQYVIFDSIRNFVMVNFQIT